LGNAVRRNRAKRRLRAAITPHLKNTTPGWDVIFIARQALLYSEWSKLRSGITELLHRAMILK
jgi:ribonuclease P protein component